MELARPVGYGLVCDHNENDESFARLLRTSTMIVLRIKYPSLTSYL